MGLRESKIRFFSYEEVQKRVNEDEMKRLRLAFKRIAGASGVMGKSLFLREVLGDGVPPKLAEQMYIAFGGNSKGIYFKDLVCGLALLTRGSLMDKLRFIFEIYSSDGNYVCQDDMESLLLASEGGRVPDSIRQLFALSEKVTSPDFCDWLRRHPDSITLSKWLVKQGNGLQLTDYGDTPTFYQTLAKFTGLQELDIIELEKRYWYLKSGTKTGKFDLETFIPLVSSCVSDSLAKALFNAFDENQDGHIDFREIACGISTCCRGPVAERFAFTFKIFDVDRDGLLSTEEIRNMIETMIELKSENIPHSPLSETEEEIHAEILVTELLSDYGADEDGFLTLDEYKNWATTQSLSRLVLDILFQICHVVFGLRPATRKDEYQVIWGWLDRENFRGLQPGTTWFLVAIDWWKKWKEFVGRQKSTVARSLSTGALEKNGISPLSSPLSSTTSQAWDRVENSQRKVTVARRSSQPQRSIAPLVAVNGVVTSKPGTIDNSCLVEPDTRKVQSLTADGGKLKCSVPLVRGRDFEIVPESVWKALVQWYTGSPALPRNVIIPVDGDPTPFLELFPRLLLLYRHAQPPAKSSFTSWSGMGFGMNGLSFGTSSGGAAAQMITPRRQLSYTAVFSRMNTLQQLFDFLCQRLRFRPEDVRLWNMADENNLQLLDEDQFAHTLEALGIVDQHCILVEIRNRDMSWPEEMTSLALNKAILDKRPHGKGMTGLSNLGNTCFMNSAIQCMSNTTPLTNYFTDGYHLYELNKVNPLGMKGNIAKRYGEVVQDLWSTSCRSIAPLKLRWTIGRYAPRFNGFQQQDSQEFLAFLLDGLHEDLNRVHAKPYVELKDSDGRPDEEVAKEAWDNHLKRNKSIVVDLFQGQLKSCVRCLQCNHVSVRFDPYTFLSLPIPMDNSIYVECIVVTLDGLVPIKYGLLLNTDDNYKKLKRQLAKLCDLTHAQLLMAELIGASIKGQPLDSQKVRSSLSGILYAFEIPAPSVNTPPCIEVVTEGEATNNVDTESDITATPVSGCGVPRPECSDVSTQENENSVPERLSEDQPCEMRTVTTELVRSPSRTSSERSYGGSLKLPCLSRQTSDDEDDDGIEVGSEVSGRSNMGLLRQLSPGFMRKLSSKKSMNVWSATDTPESRDQSAASSAKSTPGHSRNTSISSTSGSPLHTGTALLARKPSGYLIGVHRKLMRMDVYFIAPQKNRPSLFGCPLIIPCTAGTKNGELYQSVWQQVSRFLSAPSPGDDLSTNRENGYPFELKIVSEGGLSCAVCPWFKFCRGCTVACNDEQFNCNCHYIAIEWEPTTLHLRYQSSQEKVFTEHESVERSRRLQTEPIDLYECFKAFTKEEELGEDELWYCSKCKKHQLACKKLDIWSLPPILIIHLKRFQFMNGRWVKSNKIVNFPMENFDPSEFVVKRPTAENTEGSTCIRMVNVQTVVENISEKPGESSSEMSTETSSDKNLLTSERKNKSDSGLLSNSSGYSSNESCVVNECSVEMNEDCDSQSTNADKHSEEAQTNLNENKHSLEKHSNEDRNSGKVHLITNGEVLGETSSEIVEDGECFAPAGQSNDISCGEKNDDVDRVYSSSSSKASDMNCVGINSVEILNVENSSVDVSAGQNVNHVGERSTPHILYNLYTISSHTGVMGGGHYVSFSKNPNSKWYCFNDSSCKETSPDRVQKESPYLLFYERVGMDYKQFQPDVQDRNPDSSNDEDEIDNELKKACVLQ